MIIEIFAITLLPLLALNDTIAAKTKTLARVNAAAVVGTGQNTTIKPLRSAGFTSKILAVADFAIVGIHLMVPTSADAPADVKLLAIFGTSKRSPVKAQRHARFSFEFLAVADFARV